MNNIVEPLEIPDHKPRHDKTNLPHDAGVESIRGLERKKKRGYIVLFLINYHIQCTLQMMRHDTYQYPEEECDLKCVLKENEMDQEKDNPWFAEPEVVI